MSFITTVSADTPVWASHYNLLVNALNQALADRNYASVTLLKAVDMSAIAYTTFAFVHDIGFYRWIPGSVLGADDYNIVQPTTGTGRWKLEIGGGAGRTYATVALLKAVVTTGISYPMRAEVTDIGTFLFDPTSTLVADDFSVVQPTTGSGRWLLMYAHPDVILGLLDEDLADLRAQNERLYQNFVESLYLEASLSWGSISTTAVSTQTVVVQGAQVGDIVCLGMPVLDAGHRFGLHWYGITAPDTLLIALRNNHTASLTPNTDIWRIEVRRMKNA